MIQAIHQGDRGDAVREFQHHLNDRLRAHGDTLVPINGIAGPQLLGRAAFAAWFLGALMDTVRTVQGGTITVGVEQMIADPDSRDEGQLERARERRGKPFPEAATSALTIITTAEWGARLPSQRITTVGAPSKIIFHHTDVLHPEIDHLPGDTIEEAKALARAIQRDHMDNRGFIDTGQNFLVTRSGHVLEGRHGSVDAITAGRMVDSAHCRTQNHHPGIEHEHKGDQQMTDAQRQASVALHEFICRHTGIKPTEIHPHHEFDNTKCPGALEPEIARISAELTRRLM
jgi:hypothetical protein